MKVLTILGSRNPEGQTATAAQALHEGVTEKGGEAHSVYLPDLQIERCRQCDERGWGQCRREGSCVIEDDFASLVDGIRRSDAVVFATPVYFSDLSESMRAFTDRLRRICMHDDGKAGIAGKQAIGICVAGGGGGGGPACTVSLEKVLRTAGLDMVDLVPVRRQNLAFKRAILKATGAWLAEGTPEE